VCFDVKCSNNVHCVHFTAVFQRTHCAFTVYSRKSSYYAGIMLNAFGNLLCSKLCWHNWRKPTHVDKVTIQPSSCEVSHPNLRRYGLLNQTDQCAKEVGFPRLGHILVKIVYSSFLSINSQFGMPHTTACILIGKELTNC